MIHIFREMCMDKTLNNKRVYTDSKGSKFHYGPKILIVVCMYNEGIGAINLTL